MQLKIKGIPYDIPGPIVARVTRDNSSKEPHQVLLVERESSFENIGLFEGILTTQDRGNINTNHPLVHSVASFDHLVDGDIVVVNSDGVIRTLFRVNSRQNFLLVTERCNSNCLMCSQPPKDKNDIPYLFGIYKRLIPLIPKDCEEIGITGGEPTLLGKLFFEFLQMLKTELPQSEVHCLTNGRSFAWNNISQKLGELDYKKLMLGIPLYSDYYRLHDYIVQAKNAFNQTMQGIYNLASYGQRIEIRVVLHKLSVPRLRKLARYIYSNLPFVEHVAFMALENQGYTPYNADKLWIDPVEYMEELGDATEFLSQRGLNVSIYNSQLCLMPRELWKYNKKAISDWKNIYLKECSQCAMINECGGLFASSVKMHSAHLKAFEQAIN